jgi:hypothetical protein
MVVAVHRDLTRDVWGHLNDAANHRHLPGWREVAEKADEDGA